MGSGPSMKVLQGIPGGELKEIASGCCGMAGSFGYEEEHYSLSQKIASLKLYPEIEASPEECHIIANGISCRSQIAHGTSFKAKHLVEAIYDFLDFDEIKRT